MTNQLYSLDLMHEHLADYLSRFSNYYPGIGEWFTRTSGALRTGERECLVAWERGRVAGLAITKRGERSKLCHISVAPHARTKGLGRTLMSHALLRLVKSGANDICVTTGEEVYREHGQFFLGSGFTAVDWHLHRYRRGVAEIIWTAPSNRIVEKLQPAPSSDPTADACLPVRNLRYGALKLFSGTIGKLPDSHALSSIDGRIEAAAPTT